jgi:hypothetical protein
MNRVSCWEDGPRDERDVGSTCMLDDRHDGPHVFTPDDEIMVRFEESNE